jgi:hypothetical protein
MASSAVQSLMLSIQANDEVFRSVCLRAAGAADEFRGRVEKSVDAVEARFSAFQADGLSSGLKAQQRQFEQSFAAIRAAADKALSGNRTDAGALGLDIASLRASQSAAQQQAIAIREIVAAAERAALATGDMSEATRVYLQAGRAAAIAADEEAVSFGRQAGSAEILQAELNRTASATVAASGATISHTGHTGRASIAQMELQHVVRSTADSFAAGLPLAMIFGEQVGRIGEAAALSGGSMGALGTFLAGPWGLAVTAGASVLAVLVTHLVDAGSAATEAKVGANSLSDAQSVLGQIFDLTTGKMEHQNEILRLNARLTAENFRADALKQREASADTFRGSNSASILSEIGAFFSRSAPGTGPIGRVEMLQGNAAKAAALVKGLQSGAIDPDTALQRADKLDYTGLKVTKAQLKQAIIDAADADLKDQMAKEIDTALNTGVLPSDLKRVSHRKSPVDHSTEKAFTADADFSGERRKLLDQLFGAERSTSTVDAQRDQLQRDKINADADAEKRRIADQLGKEISDPKASQQVKDIAAARAAELDGINEKVRQQKLQNVDLARQSTIIDQQYAAKRAELDDQLEVLGLQSGLATTRKAQLDIERQILADRQQERRDEIERVKKNPLSTEQELAEAKRREKFLPAIEGAENQSLDQRYASPIAAYKHELKGATDDMGEALQGVAVDGLKGIENGFVGVITGTKSVSAAFKEMAATVIGDRNRLTFPMAA